jgi:hypothetical protein
MSRLSILLFLLGGALVVGAGYLFDSGFLVFGGAAIALGPALAAATWNGMTAKARIITTIDDKFRAMPQGETSTSDTSSSEK